MRKPISKYRFLKFKKKTETDDKKYEESDLKFEETDQQTVIFKVFEKIGNGSKIWKNGPKILGIPSKIFE